MLKKPKLQILTACLLPVVLHRNSKVQGPQQTGIDEQAYFSANFWMETNQ